MNNKDNVYIAKFTKQQWYIKEKKVKEEQRRVEVMVWQKAGEACKAEEVYKAKKVHKMEEVQKMEKAQKAEKTCCKEAKDAIKKQVSNCHSPIIVH